MNYLIKPIICSANDRDIPLIEALLEQNDLPIQGVRESIENFITLYCKNILIGTVGLEIYGYSALLRSLAVIQTYQKKGYGKMLCREIIERATFQRISELYLLTETAESFFFSLGFRPIFRESADPGVQNSEEFRSICPSTAICMRKVIRQAKT
ncbi:arsenic resistance N-acetyltransferase ArsN2 [Fulvivirgaceae bacterium BMA10]|uniref:Arsenic resistance N-acetyltransferase ArsN2 n=1 Tax=Splendidivirga corallicola TaxID=3051826 RepID=A0ABT8KWE2_9BACT|nr:arsenic resistance N-acetyltransferase ArsN2 [Fulvivirgaceae bacterium BMA10]